MSAGTCPRCGSWLSSTIHANGDWCPCLRPCAHCGRPLDHGADFSDTDRCAGRLGAGCLAYVAGRRDGIDEGVRLAEQCVYFDSFHGLVLSDLYAAAAKALEAGR